jgi:hypothetical protein
MGKGALKQMGRQTDINRMKDISKDGKEPNPAIQLDERRVGINLMRLKDSDVLQTKFETAQNYIRITKKLIKQNKNSF